MRSAAICLLAGTRRAAGGLAGLMKSSHHQRHAGMRLLVAPRSMCHANLLLHTAEIKPECLGCHQGKSQQILRMRCVHNKKKADDDELNTSNLRLLRNPRRPPHPELLLRCWSKGGPLQQAPALFSFFLASLAGAGACQRHGVGEFFKKSLTHHHYDKGSISRLRTKYVLRLS